jgi:hypothetical protein
MIPPFFGQRSRRRRDQRRLNESVRLVALALVVRRSRSEVLAVDAAPSDAGQPL